MGKFSNCQYFDNFHFLKFFDCRTKVSFGRTVLILNKDYESDRVRDFV